MIIHKATFIASLANKSTHNVSQSYDCGSALRSASGAARAYPKLIWITHNKRICLKRRVALSLVGAGTAERCPEQKRIRSKWRRRCIALPSGLCDSVILNALENSSLF